MTKREFFTAVKENETLTEEIRNYAEAEISKLDAANESRRNARAEKAEENSKLAQKIYDEVLTEEPVTATQLGETLGMSYQKVATLLRKFVEDGTVKAEKLSIPKRGKVTHYSKVTQ